MKVRESHMKTCSDNNSKFKQGYMPFLFRGKRSFPPHDHSQSPPIGSYDLPSCFNQKPIESTLKPVPSLHHKFLTRQQMSIFKSGQHRFKNRFTLLPAPNAYKTEVRKIEYNRPGRQRKDYDNKTTKNHPSIPSFKHNLTNIDKKKSQKAAEEKKNMIEYHKSLTGETVNRSPKMRQKSQKLKLNRKSIEKYLIKNETKTQKGRKSIPKPKFITRSNHKTHTMSHNDFLGPGYYDCRLSTLNQQKKKFIHQFFGSSEIRFKENTKSRNVYFFHAHEHKSSNNQKQLRNKLRKPLVPFHNHQNQLQKIGPGQYDPDGKVTKKRTKNAIISKEPRFKALIREAEEEEEPSQVYESRKAKKVIPGTLRKPKFRQFHNRNLLTESDDSFLQDLRDKRESHTTQASVLKKQQLLTVFPRKK